MLRVFLLSVALCQVVLAFPDNLLNKEELERDIESLEQLLGEKEERNREAEYLNGDKREVKMEEGEVMKRASTISIIGRPTSQSSDYSAPLYTSELAADGDRNTIQYPFNACTSTQEKLNPWWQVALDGEHCITKVTLLNRGDCCSERLEGAVVRAGCNKHVMDNPVCGLPVTSGQAKPRGGLIDKTCDRPLTARYISVDIPAVRILQLCEVLVEGTVGPC
ncbi:fucolectin-1-like isoform X1 [Asterias rubens]|uniref:fucolectin-1-like isoform X1 n=1 Tax=Asterias rubens TaxID=7604 RepID=UPI0014557318|nr:fucolectin-1-like isoform X1 [Asterias rubens]